MVTGGKTLSAVLVVAAVLSAAACAANDQNGPVTSAQWAEHAGPDLNCPDRAIVRPDSTVLYYDITGDGAAESFVDLICTETDAASAPDQVEVFKGTDRSSRLARLTSVADKPDQQMFLARGCIYFTRNRVTVIGHIRDSRRPGGGATVLAAQVSTWTKNGLLVGRPAVLDRAGGLPPGCD